MNSEESKKEILDFLDRQETINDLVKSFVQNKEIPLSERWDIFVKAGAGSRESCYEDFETIGYDVSWYDDYYLERRETIEMPELVRRFSGKKGSSKKRIDKLKEEILEKFIWSFEHDW